MQINATTSIVTVLLAGGLTALVVWATGSVISLAIAPALLGLSSLVADCGASILRRSATRYAFGIVQYGVLGLWGLGGLIALVLMGPV